MTNTLTFTAGKSKNCIQFMLFPAVNVNVFVLIRILNANVNVKVFVLIRILNANVNVNVFFIIHIFQK